MRIDLNDDDWSVREALGLTWQWYAGSAEPVTTGNNVADAAAAVARTPGWLPGRVPGSVTADLERAGEIPSPYRARDSRLSEWVSTRSWVYRRIVTIPRAVSAERVVLVFDGVDPSATVFVDGAVVGRIDGPYGPHRLDITERVRAGGEHALAVVLHPSPPSQPQVGRTAEVRRHRPRMTEGWDFCPRMPHQGLWRPARIEIGDMLVEDCRVDASIDGDAGIVHVRAILGAMDADTLRPVRIVVSDQAGRIVAERVQDPVVLGVDRAQLDAQLTVDAPHRWWPSGYGAQPLYRVSLHDGDQVLTSRRVGFRSLRFETNPTGPADALAYTAIVNGRPIALTGWNWAPADARYGEITTDRLRHLVGLAAASGARLLRVWGGGLIETEDFYDACDEAGLLVWQEFSQSSSGMQSAPATDDAFIDHLRAQARIVIPPLVHHPSLAWWGGGNELDLDGVPLDEHGSPALAALRAEVTALDPTRGWLPTSPTGPRFHNRMDVIAADPDGQHDVHGPWEHQGLVDHYTLYNAGTSLAHTEFGVEGMATERLLTALVPAADRWPVDRTNPVYRHLGEWWNNADLVSRSFAGRLTDVAGYRRASQLLQATGLQYAVEADRRRSPRCSMVLPWQLAESFPNAWCTAVVDHRGDAKPAYHAVRRAFADDRVTIRVPRAAWGGEDELVAQAWLWSRDGRSRGTVTLALLDDHGRVIADCTSAAHSGPVGLSGPTAPPAPTEPPVPDGLPAPAGRTSPSRPLDPSLDHVRHPEAVVDLAVPRTRITSEVVLWCATWHDPDGRIVDRELSFATTGPDWSGLLDLPSADLDVRLGADDDRWTVEIEHRGGPVAIGLDAVDARPLDAPGWAVVELDPRPLLPGESRTVTVDWLDAPGPRALTCGGWNSTTYELTGAGVQPTPTREGHRP